MPVTITRYDKKKGEYVDVQYTTVAERLIEMKKDTEGKYDLITELLEHSNGIWVVKATLKLSNGIYTGHAYEKDNSSQINQTSALENCETSAIGRALAAAGYVGREFCSADELANALQQQQNQKATEKQVNLIKAKINAANATAEQEKKWLDQAGITKWEDCPIEKVQKIIDFLTNKLQKSE